MFILKMRKTKARERLSELLEPKHLTKAPAICLVIVGDLMLESECDKVAVPLFALK